MEVTYVITCQKNINITSGFCCVKPMRHDTFQFHAAILSSDSILHVLRNFVNRPRAHPKHIAEFRICSISVVDWIEVKQISWTLLSVFLFCSPLLS